MPVCEFTHPVTKKERETETQSCLFQLFSPAAFLGIGSLSAGGLVGGAAISAIGAIIKTILKANNQERYVRVTNTMGKDVVVTANCASGDDTIEEQKLNDGEGFAWKFSVFLLYTFSIPLQRKELTAALFSGVMCPLRTENRTIGTSTRDTGEIRTGSFAETESTMPKLMAVN